MLQILEEFTSPYHVPGVKRHSFKDFICPFCGNKMMMLDTWAYSPYCYNCKHPIHRAFGVAENEAKDRLFYHRRHTLN